ncbi:MAG TPA: InlB B-repeat-containing protein [Acholeplasmataceae bacterium]|nr:InlB B-repeat-containing protein [Acholeplasmataceae bacterium]
MQIKYELNGGVFNPKNDIKVKFYQDLYYFINENYNQALAEIEFIEFIHLEPYLIGKYAGKYFLEQKPGSKLEEQSEDYFIGYCYKNNKHVNLIKLLIPFFKNWRTIEHCNELNADDFFASSWAALVDTAKYFKFETKEQLQNSKEAPQIKNSDLIWEYMTTYPDAIIEVFETDEKEIVVPIPQRNNYLFLGWYTDSSFRFLFNGKLTKNITLYAKWKTIVNLHSNDGYNSFESLYTDFLKDFSLITGLNVTKESIQNKVHGSICDFLVKSYGGKLDYFLSNKKMYTKWIWLIKYLQNNVSDHLIKEKFNYENNKFNSEPQVRYELNSLFVGRFHLNWPKTVDYSGDGIKENLASSTASLIEKKYIAADKEISLPKRLSGKKVIGWSLDIEGSDIVLKASANEHAFKTLYAIYEKE